MTNYITKTIKNGVEANIPVTSVNGQYGDVVVAGKEYNAGEGIKIGTVQDYSAMRGPCPVGFHVPTKDEWQDILNKYTGLGLSKTDGSIYINLKLPNGVRGYTDGVLGTGRRYYTCSAYGVHIDIRSNAIYFPSSGTLCYGLPIRAVSNKISIPDSSWTTIYDGSSVATNAGIFHNATLGLISISSDGTNWITISDKNVGATTVWNSGDTVTDANGGYLYQWGNNYGFSRSGTITTSSTQVDATGYGPGNYYSSSTFITATTSGNNWSSVTNNNLRGGETGVVTYDNVITNTGVLSVNGQTGNISNVVTGDAQYVINVSTTAPSSGTASNIITIVTD